MKDWLVTLALAGAALFAFYTLFAQRPPEPPPVTRPVSDEPGPNGYLGLSRWLRAQQLEPIVWRDRFTSLQRLSAPRRGNLMISTAPHVYPLRNSEFAALRRWIEEGNTLLMVAALSDEPEWAQQGEAQMLADLERLTGLDTQVLPGGTAIDASQEVDSKDTQKDAENDSEETSEEDEAAGNSQVQPNRLAYQPPGVRLQRPMRRELVPNEAHPLLEGIDSVVSESEFPSAFVQLGLAKTRLALELARVAPKNVPVLWLMRAGRGQIIISGFGSVFTNKLLGEADNAQFMANVVRWSLAADGRVVIDDAHQGSVEYYDPEAFFSDPRLYRTGLCLLVLWLVFVLGPQRLRIPSSQWRPADLTAFVRAIGGFMARALHPAAAARQMFALFFAEIQRRTGLPAHTTPPWDWLHTYSGADSADLASLRRLHEEAQGNRRVNLQQLHNLLMRVRSSWLQH